MFSCYSSEPGLGPLSLAPETWEDQFVDLTGVVSQVLGEGKKGSQETDTTARFHEFILAIPEQLLRWRLHEQSVRH
jgi:hypothetical protein